MNMTKWNVEIQFRQMSACIFKDIEANSPGDALDAALAKDHRHWSWETEDFPRYPRFTVRPQEHVDVDYRSQRAGRDAQDQIVEEWLYRHKKEVTNG